MDFYAWLQLLAILVAPLAMGWGWFPFGACANCTVACENCTGGRGPQQVQIEVSGVSYDPGLGGGCIHCDEYNATYILPEYFTSIFAEDRYTCTWAFNLPKLFTFGSSAPGGDASCLNYYFIQLKLLPSGNPAIEIPRKLQLSFTAGAFGGTQQNLNNTVAYWETEIPFDETFDCEWDSFEVTADHDPPTTFYCEYDEATARITAL